VCEALRSFWLRGDLMRVRSVLTVIAATSVTALLASAAVADVDKPAEGAGDVSIVASSGDTYASEQSVNVDVTRHSVSHGKKITIKSRYTDLATPSKGDLIALLTWLKVKNGTEYSFTLGATKNDKSGTPRLFSNNTQLTCKGMSVKFDYDAETVVASVPRSCLGDPAWLRYYTEASFDTGSDYFSDRVGTTGPGYREKPNYSPKLYKG